MYKISRIRGCQSVSPTLRLSAILIISITLIGTSVVQGESEEDSFWIDISNESLEDDSIPASKEELPDISTESSEVLTEDLPSKLSAGSLNASEGQPPITSQATISTTSAASSPTTSAAPPPTISAVPPPTSSEAPPPTTSSAPPPTTSATPPPTTSATPPPTTSQAPPPTTSAAPPPTTSAAPPPTTSEAPPPTTTSAAPPPSTSAASSPTSSEAPPPTTSQAPPLETSPSTILGPLHSNSSSEKPPIFMFKAQEASTSPTPSSTIPTTSPTTTPPPTTPTTPPTTTPTTPPPTTPTTPPTTTPSTAPTTPPTIPPTAPPSTSTPSPSTSTAAPMEKSFNGDPMSISSVTNCDPPKLEMGKMTMTCRSRTSLPTDIPDPETITALDMSEGNMINILTKDQLTLSKLTRISLLNLSNSQIRVIEQGAFIIGDKYPMNDYLEELDLSNNHIDVLDPQIFSGLTNLKFLSLQNNPIKSFGEHAAFPPLNSLATLDISSCRFDTLSVNLMDNLKNLEKLYLNGNRLSQLNWRVFRQTRKLGYVNLENNPWHCDCHVRFVIQFLDEGPVEPGFKKAICETTSKTSSSYTGAFWDSVPSGEMTCSPKIDRWAVGSQTTMENDAVSEVKIGADVFLECDFSGYPKPNVKFRKDAEEVSSSKDSNEQSIPVETAYSSDKDDEKYQYNFKESLVLRDIGEPNAGKYSCIVEDGAGGSDEKTLNLKVIVTDGDEGSGDGSGSLWAGLSIILICVMVFTLIFVHCFVKRMKKKKQKQRFTDTSGDIYEHADLNLGDFNVRRAGHNLRPTKSDNQPRLVPAAIPLLEKRTENNNDLQPHNGTPVPDVIIHHTDDF